MPETALDRDGLFREYAGLLLRLHLLLLEGKAEGEEVDALEDALSAAWKGLDEARRQSLKGIGSDLNWVRRGGAPAPKARSAEEVDRREVDRLAAAEAANDWNATLHSLRVCAPLLHPYEVARRRQHAYEAAGLHDLARVFGAFAEQITGRGARKGQQEPAG